MKNALSFCIVILFLSIGMVSCVRDVSLDAGEKPQVAVSLLLTDDPQQILRLSFTKGASLQEAPPVTDARVTLIDKDTGERMPFQRGEGIEWTLAYAAISGHNYRLEVEVPGYDLIYAEQKMIEVERPYYSYFHTNLNRYIEPYSGWIHHDVGEAMGYNEWPEGEDPPPLESYYFVAYPKNVPTPEVYAFKYPVWICGMNYNPETGRREIAKEICASVTGDPFNLTGRYYVPPTQDIPIPYKIPKGIKTRYPNAASAHILELYPDLAGVELHDSFLRLPADKSAGYFYISGSFSGPYYSLDDVEGERWRGYWGLQLKDAVAGAHISAAGEKGYLLFATVSHECDLYLKAVFYYKQIHESSDLSTIYLRDNIYTNIRGGLGIFGTVAYRIYPWENTYSYVDTGFPKPPLSRILDGFYGHGL